MYHVDNKDLLVLIMGKHDSKVEKAKLVGLFALPFLIFLFVALRQISQHEVRVRNISSIEQQIKLSIYINAFVHELQKERGDSGIYLSSKGALFSDKLDIQRGRVNENYRQLRNYLSTFDYFRYHKDFVHLLEVSLLDLKRLEKVRDDIFAHQISATEAIDYFTGVNNKLLSVIEAVAYNSTETDLVFAILAYSNFLRGKELLGVERALLSQTFTQDYFSAGAYRRFMKLITEQNIYHQRFLSFTSTELANEFKRFDSETLFKKVQAYRDIAHQNEAIGRFGVNVTDWFNVMTSKIDQLKILEDAITNDLTEKAIKKKTSSEGALVRWRSFIFLISLAMGVIGLWIIRRISLAFERKLEEYRILFEKSSAGMVVVNPISKNILFCNAAFAKKLAYTKGELSSLNLFELYPEESLPACDFTASDFLKVDDGLSFVRQNGSVFQAEVAVFPIHIAGTLYVVGSIKDITQRQKAMNENLLLLEQNQALIQRNYALQEAERRDIAGELHDQLGQEMVGIMLQADSLNQFSVIQDQEGIRLTSTTIAKSIRALITSTRNLTNKLRPVTLDQLGLESALKELIDDWSKFNHDTHFKYESHNKLPKVHDQVAICIYRLVQENLTNIAKHAKASDVSIYLRYDECLIELDAPALTLLIIDNGVGMTVNNKLRGMGVIGMRERVQALDGLFFLTSKPNHGVKIVAHIPL